MSELIVYKRMPVWHRDSLPGPFLQHHNTKAGTWAQLRVLKGSLTFALMTEDGETTESFDFSVDRQPPLIEPQQWHRIVSVSDDIECQLEFLCDPADYFAKKYELTRTHSEVLEAAKQVPVGRALDLGCGNGRNVLYLAKKGFHVDAWDYVGDRLDNLQRIADAEQLDNVYVSEVDLNDISAAPFDGPYDVVLSTVVLMFLQPASIPPLIQAMQAQTKPGGYNLIVSAMDSDDYPCTVPFPFRFQRGDLQRYYEGWEFIKYNEDPGKLHKTDENGNRIQMRFATMLAKKPG